jgi:hypothetical protein
MSLAPFLVVGAAVALPTLLGKTSVLASVPAAPPHVPGLDELLGRPETLGDGTFQPEEKAYCTAQCDFAEQSLADLGFWKFSALPEADLRKRALVECRACKAELKEHIGAIMTPTVEEAVASVGEIGGKVASGIGSIVGKVVDGAVGNLVFYGLVAAGGYLAYKKLAGGK